MSHSDASMADSFFKVIPVRNPVYDPSHPKNDLARRWKQIRDELNSARTETDPVDKAYLSPQTPEVPLSRLSRIYLDRAIEGHRRALANLTVENIGAVFITSNVVSNCALFTLSEIDEDATLDPIQWLHLSRGIKFICQRWREMVGKAWMLYAGIFYGTPDLTDDDELFDYENCRPFERLLSWAKDFEVITPEDRETYQQTLSYIGRIYKRIVNGSDDRLTSCRRFMAMPPRLQPRFVDLVEAKQPRAIVMLAHFFALMKLVEDEVTCLRGIAERPVPKFQAQLPIGWQEMMAWPMAVVRGEVRVASEESAS